MRLILASASPRRAELLTSAGFSFEIRAVDVDERVRDGEAPADYVARLASEKSKRAMDVESRRDLVALGADTTVVVDGQILAKPRDDDDARRMLRLLAGRSHEVMTGVSLRTADEELRAVETTSVTFSLMSEADIEWYVRTGEGRDKAGAYAIQGVASRFIPRISGSYSNVVGLPVALVAELLVRIHSA